MAQEPRDLTEYQTDHDLLIKTHTLMEVMSDKIDKLAGNFVTQAAFWPVKTLVYGCIGLMLTAIVTTLLYLVITHWVCHSKFIGHLSRVSSPKNWGNVTDADSTQFNDPNFKRHNGIDANIGKRDVMGNVVSEYPVYCPVEGFTVYKVGYQQNGGGNEM